MTSIAATIEAPPAPPARSSTNAHDAASSESSTHPTSQTPSPPTHSPKQSPTSSPHEESKLDAEDQETPDEAASTRLFLTGVIEDADWHGFGVGHGPLVMGGWAS